MSQLANLYYTYSLRPLFSLRIFQAHLVCDNSLTFPFLDSRTRIPENELSILLESNEGISVFRFSSRDVAPLE